MLKNKLFVIMLNSVLALNISPIGNIIDTSTEETNTQDILVKDSPEDGQTNGNISEWISNNNETQVSSEGSNGEETDESEDNDSETTNTENMNIDDVSDSLEKNIRIDAADDKNRLEKISPASITGSKIIRNIFPDSNVAQEVADSLGKLSTLSLVTQKDLDKIEVFIVDGVSVTNIEGIQHLRNLNLLSFQDTKNISSLAPLGTANLPYLKKIYLKNNQITDLSPLGNLTSLEEIYIENNRLTSLLPLSNLSNLRILSFQNDISDRNEITSLNGLENLKNLKTIYGKDNKITSLEPLKEVDSLTDLFLEGNKLTNLNGLQNKVNLTALSVMYQKISDISSIKESVNLKQLFIRENTISDISVLSNFPDLELLLMENNHISDISSLKNLAKLSTFNGTNQMINLEKNYYYPQKKFIIANMIIGKLGNKIPPIEISNSGVYSKENIEWELSSGIKEVSFKWNTSESLPGPFSGQVVQSLEEREGSLSFIESPQSIDFGIHTISNKPISIFGEFLGNLRIKDERFTGNWKIGLKQKEPLTNGDFEIPKALSFVTPEGTTLIGSSFITVYGSNQKGEIDLNYLFEGSDKRGIRIDIPVEYQRVGQFKTKLEWALEDAP